MANYPNKQFDSYVKDADIKQQILLTNPLTENLNKAKKINEFVKDILKENYKHKDVDQKCNIRKNPKQKHQCNETIVQTLVTHSKSSFVTGGSSANRTK